MHDFSISIVDLQKLLNMRLLLGNSEIEDSESVLVGKSLNNIAALDHPRFSGSPKGRVHHSCSVSGKGSPNGNISDSSCSLSLQDEGRGGEEDAEESCVCPEGNLITESIVSWLR